MQRFLTTHARSLTKEGEEYQEMNIIVLAIFTVVNCINTLHTCSPTV